MTYIVSYTSQSEGFTIGATGDSMVEALSQLAEEFGEGITLLYEHTHRELSLIVETIEKERTPADVAQDPTDEEIQQMADEAEAGYSKEELREREALATFRGDVPDPDVPVPQTRGKAADEKAGSTEDLTETCSICGAGITKDRAIASELTYGDKRCSECSA